MDNDLEKALAGEEGAILRLANAANITVTSEEILTVAEAMDKVLRDTAEYNKMIARVLAKELN